MHFRLVRKYLKAMTILWPFLTILYYTFHHLDTLSPSLSPPLPFSFLNSKYQPDIKAFEARIAIIMFFTRTTEEPSIPGPKSQGDGGESLWSQEWELSCWGRSCRQHLVMGTGTHQLFQGDVKDTERRWSVSPDSLVLCTFPALQGFPFVLGLPLFLPVCEMGSFQ